MPTIKLYGDNGRRVGVVAKTGGSWKITTYEKVIAENKIDPVALNAEIGKRSVGGFPSATAAKNAFKAAIAATKG